MKRLKIITGILCLVIIHSCTPSNKRTENLYLKNFQVRTYSETEDLNANIKIFLELENFDLDGTLLKLKVYKNNIYKRTYYDSIKKNFSYIIINDDTCKLILRGDDSSNFFLNLNSGLILPVLQ